MRSGRSPISALVSSSAYHTGCAVSAPRASRCARVRAHGRVAEAVGGVALQVDPRRARGHRLGDVVGRPQRRGERVADPRRAAAGHRVGLVDAEGDTRVPGDRQVARERRAGLEARLRAEQRVRSTAAAPGGSRAGSGGRSAAPASASAPSRVPSAGSCASPTRRARQRDAGRERRDRPAVGPHLGVVVRRVPRQPRAGRGARRRRARCRPRRPRATARARAFATRGLACGGAGVVVGEPDRQQHPPAAAARERAEAAQVARFEHAARPRGPGRRSRRSTRSSCRPRCPRSASTPGPSERSRPTKLPLLPYVGDLRQRGGLEGEPEEARGNGPAVHARVDLNVHRHGALPAGVPIPSVAALPAAQASAARRARSRTRRAYPSRRPRAPDRRRRRRRRGRPRARAQRRARASRGRARDGRAAVLLGAVSSPGSKASGHGTGARTRQLPARGRTPSGTPAYPEPRAAAERTSRGRPDPAGREPRAAARLPRGILPADLHRPAVQHRPAPDAAHAVGRARRGRRRAPGSRAGATRDAAARRSRPTATTFDDYLAFLAPRLARGAPAARARGHAVLPHRLPRGAPLQGAARRDLRARVLPQRDHLGLRLRRAHQAPLAGQARHDPRLRAETPTPTTSTPRRSTASPTWRPAWSRPRRPRAGKLPTDVWWHTIVPTNGAREDRLPDAEARGHRAAHGRRRRPAPATGAWTSSPAAARSARSPRSSAAATC